MNMGPQRHIAISFLALGTLLLTLVVFTCDDLQAQELPLVSAKSAQGITIMEAVKSTLVNHTFVQIQEMQVNINKGLRQQASGQFDTLLGSGVTQSRTNDPLTLLLQQEAGIAGVQTSGLLSNITTYGVSAGKLWRNGVTVNATLGVSRDLDNLTNLGGLSNSHVSLVLEIPFLRNRGRKTVAAREDAATLEVEGSQYDLNQLIAQLMANTASTYWNCVAARKSLMIAEEAEQRGRAYVENVQAFIDADRVPHSDIHEVTANLAGRTATRIAAEHQITATRQQLALDMGLPPEQMSSVPETLDNFPNSENQVVPSNKQAATQDYLAESLRRRADYLAAGMREAEARRLLAAARNQLLPGLNLSVTTGYSGLREGRALSEVLHAPFGGVQGMNVGVGINYSFAPRNDSARGQLLQSVAALKQSELRKTAISQNVMAGVSIAADAVWSAIEQSSRARESVASFRSALAAEQEKYRLGIGSVVSVLTVEDRLTSAMQELVQAELAYALALTQLRLASGTLIEPGTPVQTVDGSVFFSVPVFGNGPNR